VYLTQQIQHTIQFTDIFVSTIAYGLTVYFA